MDHEHGWTNILTDSEIRKIKNILNRFSCPHRGFGIKLHVTVENKNIYIDYEPASKKYTLLKTYRPARVRNFEPEIIPCYMLLDSNGCCITASITLEKILTSLFSIFVGLWVEAVLEPSDWKTFDNMALEEHLNNLSSRSEPNATSDRKSDIDEIC